MKTGFVTIIGLTNAGKSTLINQIMKKKISIVTSKPQTTRNAIQGIYNDDDSQIIFIDTPGLLKPHHELDTFMKKEALSTLADIDAVIFLIDASLKFDEANALTMKSRLSTVKAPIYLVFNKIDLVHIEHILKLKEQYRAYFENAIFFEISALDGFNVDALIKDIKTHLKDDIAYYPEGYLSNHPVKFLLAELIREQLLLNLKQEVPHSCAVKIDDIEKKATTNHVYARIIVEKESQKAIVIGKNGDMIKKIGTKARMQMEEILHKKINLKIIVAVENDWRNSSRILKEYGYDD